MRGSKPKRPRPRPPQLTEAQILAWADEWHAKTGRWPNTYTGRVAGQRHETWRKIDAALRRGHRGLPNRTSLACFLAEHRGYRNLAALPPFTVASILAWADQHHRQTGRWPDRDSGPIAGQEDETWKHVDNALQHGYRGLPGGSSLFGLLAEHCGVRRPAHLPPLSEAQILAWADQHHRRTGHWPKNDSGPITGTRGETWSRVQAALLKGCRGLPGGSTLPQLLEQHRGARNRKNLPPFTVEQILQWADAFYQRTGYWPIAQSGPIPEAPGETWNAVSAALAHGKRGLPGGSSLARLLTEQRGPRSRASRPYRRHKIPALSCEQIIAWAKAHHARTGRWPTDQSGPVFEAPRESWRNIGGALRYGLRGLPGGLTLRKLLQPLTGRKANKQRGKGERNEKP